MRGSAGRLFKFQLLSGSSLCLPVSECGPDPRPDREADGQHSCWRQGAGRHPWHPSSSLCCPDRWALGGFLGPPGDTGVADCASHWWPCRGPAKTSGSSRPPDFPWTEHTGLPGLSPDSGAVSPGPRGRETSSEMVGHVCTFFQKRNPFTLLSFCKSNTFLKRKKKSTGSEPPAEREKAALGPVCCGCEALSAGDVHHLPAPRGSVPRRRGAFCIPVHAQPGSGFLGVAVGSAGLRERQGQALAAAPLAPDVPALRAGLRVKE